MGESQPSTTPINPYARTHQANDYNFCDKPNRTALPASRFASGGLFRDRTSGLGLSHIDGIETSRKQIKRNNEQGHSVGRASNSAGGCFSKSFWVSNFATQLLRPTALARSEAKTRSDSLCMTIKQVPRSVAPVWTRCLRYFGHASDRRDQPIINRHTQLS